MANNSAGVYDGLPFSYLTNTSPTEKQPPRSPRLSARSQPENERGEPVGEARPIEEEAELRPFTYLTPNSPTERDIPAGSPTSSQPQYFEPLEDERPGDPQGLYNNPSFNAQNQSRRLPREGEPYPDPNVRVGSDPNYYTSIKDSEGPWDNNERNRGGQDPRNNARDYGQEPNHSNYELGGYSSIPRPRVAGELDSRDNHTNYKSDYHNTSTGFDPMPNYQKPRPLTRDSYLDPGLKQKQGCECRVVLMAIVLIILALGAGFAAGWFVSKSVNGSEDTNTGSGDANIGATTTPLMAALTSTTTTTTSTTTTTVSPKPAGSTNMADSMSTESTSTTATTTAVTDAMTSTSDQASTDVSSTQTSTLMATDQSSTGTGTTQPDVLL